MKKQRYRITFLSDIVLPATSNTEGNIMQLDFIPGSNFLGMVARHYHEFDNSFEIFHSGMVRFGDATLEINGKETYKMPSSFFHEKLDSSKIYNHHKIKDFSQFKQLKQKREGYITEDLQECFVDYVYTQKSAYNHEKRTSKKSGMYGYKAIVSGTKWLFDVTLQENIDSSKIKKYLEQSTQLGKSKSAQYGKIKIEFVHEQSIMQPKENNLTNVILYAKSRLALINEHGNSTFDLQYLCEGLKKEDIDDENSQIRTSSFTPYNTKRQTKDYERNCINKGSVIVLKQITQEQLKKLQNGVGAYLSEGFGEVLINPSFLEKEEFPFKKSELKKEKLSLQKNDIDNKRDELAITTQIGKFLKQQQIQQQEKLTIAKSVNDFAQAKKSLYTKIKPSQWGNIRSICTGSPQNYKEQIESYISNGTKKWEENQINTLRDAMESVTFTKLLAIKMGKIAQNKKEKAHD